MDCRHQSHLVPFPAMRPNKTPWSPQFLSHMTSVRHKEVKPRCDWSWPVLRRRSLKIIFWNFTWAKTSLMCWGSQVHTWVCFNPGKRSLNIFPCFLCNSSISLWRRVSLRGLMNLNLSQTVAVGISSNGFRLVLGALLVKPLLALVVTIASVLDTGPL